MLCAMHFMFIVTVNVKKNKTKRLTNKITFQIEILPLQLRESCGRFRVLLPAEQPCLSGRGWVNETAGATACSPRWCGFPFRLWAARRGRALRCGVVGWRWWCSSCGVGTPLRSTVVRSPRPLPLYQQRTVRLLLARHSASPHTTQNSLLLCDRMVSGRQGKVSSLKWQYVMSAACAHTES